MATITINIKDEINDQFREDVKLVFGSRKGALSKAITEAIQDWGNKRRSIKRNLQLLRRGINTGGLTYTKREELYDRV